MTTVTLLDGRQVDSYSREWLLETRARETEARMILKFASVEIRRAHLRKYGEQHGADARGKLEAVIKDLWARR